MDKEKQDKITSSFSELQTTKYLVERIQQLQSEVDALKRELASVKRIPSGKIGIALLVPGIALLALSIFKESQILAFIGLSLTFWGTLFFFIKPVRYVRSSLLESAVTSTYLTIDRITRDLKFKGKSYYIPPFPEDVYLPEHLKGLKEMIVFISANAKPGVLSIEDIAKSKFLLSNPNGICILPPGLGVLKQIEEELRTDLAKMDLETLTQILPSVITGNLHLAKEIEMKKVKKGIYIRINDSIYKNLYKKEQNLRSVHSLGCPLVSALICAVAKATGKVTTILRDRVSPNNQTIEFWCGFVEA